MSSQMFSASVPVDVTASEALVALIESGPGDRQRTRRAEHAGQTVWVKRYDTERVSLGMRAHRLVSKLVRVPFWRPSRPLHPNEMVRRELRKYAAFRSAGLTVPEILAARRATLVVSDVGPSVIRVLKQLRADGDAAAHDDLLVRTAAALGEVHRAGLCHGRPHPRDMGFRGSRIAFFDFEEEPELVMPLGDAQARDVWLLFLHITSLAVDAETPTRALRAYGAIAPGETQVRLAALVGSMRWIVPLGRAVSRVHLGGDLRRLLSATVFLAAATMAPGTPFGTGASDNLPIEQVRALSARDHDDGEEDPSV